MGRYLVGTQEQVEHDEAIIRQLAIAHFQSLGHQIGEVDGRTVIWAMHPDGSPDYRGYTNAWAQPQPVSFTEDSESGEIVPDDGTLWKIPSPSSDQRFHLWRDYLPEGVTVQCEEVEFVN